MNEIEARDRIRETVLPFLQDSGDSLERSLDEAAEGLLAVWQVSEDIARSPGSVGALLPFRYVIPDEDLKLVETAFSVLTTAAGVGYFMPHLGFDPTKGVVAAITGVVVAILRLVHNLRLSIRLTPEDYAIIALLAGARAEGLSADELTTGVTLSFPELSSEKVDKRLEMLGACARLNGEPAALIWQDGDGYWHANGV